MLLAYVKSNHILQQCSQDAFDLLLILYTLAAADLLPEGIVMNAAGTSFVMAINTANGTHTGSVILSNTIALVT